MRSFSIFLLAFSYIVCTLASDVYSDRNARKMLADHDISVNAPQPTTSLEGIRKSTINQLLGLKKLSKCQIVVTGGTESGHGHSARGTKSHSSGHKVDLRLNSCLNNYIKNNLRYIGQRGGDNAKMYKSRAGNIYALESNHWDVLYV